MTSSSPRKSRSGPLSNLLKKLSPKLRPASVTGPEPARNQRVVEEPVAVHRAQQATSPRKPPRPSGLEAAARSAAQLRKADEVVLAPSAGSRTDVSIPNKPSESRRTPSSNPLITIEEIALPSKDLTSIQVHRTLQPPRSLNLLSKIVVKPPDTNRLASKMASIESIGSCSLDVDATASESSAEIGGGMESSVSQRTLCSVNVELNNVNGRTRQSSHADSSPVKEKFDERPKQLSYLNISCSVSGYTSYSCYNSKAREGLRSRDNSPARFNVETSKDSGGSLPNGSHRRWSSTDRPDGVGSTECGIFHTVSSSTTTVKSTVTGYNNATVSATVTEDSVVYDTVDEAGKQTKSLIQQRIERLYGPGFLAQGFRFQREKKKVEPNQKSMLAPVPVVCRPTREHPPVFRHLRKNFCEQLTGTVSGDANHNDTKTNLGEGRTTIEMKIQQENGCADVPMSNGHHPQEKMETNVIQINGNHLDCTTDSKDVSPDLMDGAAFIRVMNEERSKIESLVARASEDLSSGKLPEDVCGRLRAAIGKANLLLSQKFEQFRGLCKKNINQDATEPFPTTVSDLAGFWDMVLIQVGDIGMMFDEIAEMRKNGWIINEKIGVTTVDGEIQEPTKLTRVQPKRTIATPSPKSEEAAKAREESRKRLMEAKRKARLQRMDSNNGNTSIEIFLPEKRD